MHQPSPHTAPLLDIAALRNSCSSCSMHQLCLPMGLDESDMLRLDSIIGRHRVRRDDSLYRIGDKFGSLYAVRVGQFKTYQASSDGARQITGFQMSGELLGMDAISTGSHQCDAVALEDSEVCDIPFARLEELFSDIPTLLRHFHRIMSKEITREQSVILLLGNMRAEQRFAAFLVNLSSRYATRGYSSTNFQLRMTREDIGNYLGLTIESISRLLSKFRKEGILKVDKRDIELVDFPALKILAMGADTCN
ncbi:CRP/FNR family transcriptional regulator, anaerobic regulatory protein [Collimonas sp. OK307]|uniref:fumarate/nitrate reduction transcriptional regulator Fnr n=1 Tax=Collimonas sp. OK307 TaxID=1801620 RepID=UPI0008E9A9A1|nr:fumarate/nitrate reduction transcriptional regulator Fnr [Collimonas sp. OK307]SFI35842.1 CRP/FNR family transcriptional regulator, anaerobic regulatory protein [Collimonas sp. OK307]